MSVDFNWILLVIGVVYKCRLLFGLLFGESKLSPPSTQKPLPKIKNYSVENIRKICVLRFVGKVGIPTIVKTH